MTKTLFIQENEAGRPCGWGLSADPKAAKEEAKRQFKSHCCYPGERKGKLRSVALSES